MGRTLNGSSDKIDISVNPDLGTDYAMWSWVRLPAVTAGLGGIIILSDSGGSQNFQFKRTNGTNLQFVGFVGGVAISRFLVGVFAADTWTFVGITRRGGDLFMINGTEAGNLSETDRGAIGVNDVDPADIQIGASGAIAFLDGDLAWTGLINDRSLTLADFNRISRRGWETPALFNLPLYGEDSPEPDLSGNGNVGALTGTSQSDGPPMGPSFGFDVGVVIQFDDGTHLDTPDKRRSALDVWATTRILPVPNSGIDVGDRVQMYLYRGLVVAEVIAARLKTLLGVGR